MATAIGPAVTTVPPQPTDPINVALQGFQNSLSAQQKTDFFASSQGAIPDTNAVLIFTAQVDCSSQRRASRCLASRMQGTLDSVERFSKVVDTFVSSNPSIGTLKSQGFLYISFDFMQFVRSKRCSDVSLEY